MSHEICIITYHGKDEDTIFLCDPEDRDLVILEIFTDVVGDPSDLGPFDLENIQEVFTRVRSGNLVDASYRASETMSALDGSSFTWWIVDTTKHLTKPQLSPDTIEDFAAMQLLKYS